MSASTAESTAPLTHTWAPAVARTVPSTPPAPSFSIGTNEPTWSNSGCRVAVSALKYDSRTNVVTSYDGQVISGLYLPHGRIEVRHANVTIRDCVIGVGWDSSRAYIQNNCGIVHKPSANTSGNLIEYVTIDPTNAASPVTAGRAGARDVWGNDAQTSGIYGYGMTVRRCAIRHVTDGVMPDVKVGQMAPSRVEGNYIETRWLAYDRDQRDGTHNDGVQLAGGNGHVIRGNTLRNPSGNSVVKGQCVVLTPYHGPITNTVIDRNWMYGAYTQVSAWPHLSEGGPNCSGTTITGNRHGGQCVWPILVTPEVKASSVAIGSNVAGPAGLTWNNGRTAAGGSIKVNVTAAR
ncbi:hypothetical protein ABEG17_09080 [Pedococcus sp. KACC 23699]|uniref:Right-handed parallel beta-helix repeat-containing protein n=1 Tax=Pedococcus sp. KACC 23699 TaxID=3149228 RepID=A0AAU7JYF6_9MICO